MIEYHIDAVMLHDIYTQLTLNFVKNRDLLGVYALIYYFWGLFISNLNISRL